jgi:hypothetical protein
VRTLIAVKSCHDDLDKGCHDTIKQTWGKNVQCDLRFFVGQKVGTPWRWGGLLDTIYLDVKDDYNSLPQKTKRILQWSFGRDYDFIFLCDVDTFLIPYKLFQTDFQKFDYSGRFGSSPKIGSTFHFKDGRGIHHFHCHPWASGGFGYALSRKAAEIVIRTESGMWAEDMMVGNCLGPEIQSGNVTASDLMRFENEASWHYPAHKLGWTRERMKLWMCEMYKEHFFDS